MCKFCEGIFDKNYDMEWNMRTSFADDNFCEKVFEDSCDNCEQCCIEYKLNGRYISESDHAYLTCEYKFDNGDIKMHNFTEILPINFCPYCGRQLVNNLVNFDDVNHNRFEIIDENNDPWDYETYKHIKDFINE